MVIRSNVKEGTVGQPRFYEGPSRSENGAVINSRLFTFDTEFGLVSGYDISVMFTLDRAPHDVWPYFKDFNLWQNSYGYFYSGIIGDMYSRDELDLGAETFQITVRNDVTADLIGVSTDSEFVTNDYIVLRIIPERLIILFQPVAEDDRLDVGGVSGGNHVFMLTEHYGKTTITGHMEHARRTTGETEEKVLEYWRTGAEEVTRFWRDIFIPNIENLVYARN